jgi:hypothetical protein
VIAGFLRKPRAWIASFERRPFPEADAAGQRQRPAVFA